MHGYRLECSLDGGKVKKVENLKYLGHLIYSRDSDFLELFLNLSKAQKHLTHILRLLMREQGFSVRCWEIICCGKIISDSV